MSQNFCQTVEDGINYTSLLSLFFGKFYKQLNYKIYILKLAYCKYICNIFIIILELIILSALALEPILTRAESHRIERDIL